MIDRLANLSVVGEIQKILIPCLFGKIDCTFCFEIVGFNWKHATVTDRTIFQNISLNELETAVSIAQEYETQHRHTILLRCDL